MSSKEQLTETVWRRREFLEHMQEGASTRKELIDDLGCSKQNVYKRTAELKDLGLLEQNRDEYSLTLYGELALQRFKELEGARRQQELLTTESIEDTLPPHAVKDAEFMVSDSAIPDETLSHIDKELHRSDVVEGFSCALFSPNRVESYRRAVMEKDTTLTAVASKEVVDYILLEHRDTALSTLRSGDINIHVTNEEIPYSVMIFDRNTITVFAYDTTTEPKELTNIKGIITNDTPEAVDWALNRFEHYKQNSWEITTDDVSKKETGY